MWKLLGKAAPALGGRFASALRRLGGTDDAARAAARAIGFTDEAAEALARSRRALPSMARTGEVSKISARPSAARTVGAAMDEAAGAAPSTFRRVAGSFGKGGKGRKYVRRGILYPAAIEGVGRVAFGASPLGYLADKVTGGTTPEAQYDVVAALDALGTGAAAAPSQAEQFRQFLAENPYGGTEFPDYVAESDAAAAQSRASLNDYLAANRAYGETNAQKIADLYQQMSQGLMRSSGDVFQRGQVTAADIDRLYEQLAAENLGTAYGEGLAAPVSDVSGLAAPSGAAATGGETARTYGASLADYLGQEAGIESAALEQIAGSQALQGAALAQSLRDYVAMAEADKRFALDQQLAAQRAAAQQARAEMEFQDRAARRAYEQQAAQQLFGFEAVEAEQRAAAQQEAEQAAALAAQVWVTADPAFRTQLSELVGGKTGQEGMNEFVRLVYSRPELLTVLGA